MPKTSARHGRLSPGQVETLQALYDVDGWCTRRELASRLSTNSEALRGRINTLVSCGYVSEIPGVFHLRLFDKSSRVQYSLTAKGLLAASKGVSNDICQDMAGGEGAHDGAGRGVRALPTS